MSGSESGVLRSGGRDGFTMNMGVRDHSEQQQPDQDIQNMRLSFASGPPPVYQIPSSATSPTYPPHQTPLNSSSIPFPVQQHPLPPPAGGDTTASLKRKRGRPRKYGPDAPTIPMIISSPHSPPLAAPGFSPPPPPPPPPSASAAAGLDGNSAKKARGRPPGSLNKTKKSNHHVYPQGPIGFGLTPHVITVRAGEDISSRIMSLSQHGLSSICILSGIGAISNVTLRQPSGTVTYEGRFDIVTLTGSFKLCEHGGQKSRAGSICVCLSGPDGSVLGGIVAGLLIAASPVQLVVGSFTADGKNEPKSGNQVDPSGTAARFAPSGSTGGSSPQSRGTLSESSGGAGSPLNHNTGISNNNNAQGMSNMTWK